MPSHRRRAWVRPALVGLGCVVALGVASVTLVFVVFGSDPALPRIGNVADYQPKIVTKIESSDGELIGELYEERRTVVPREKIPPAMIHAIVDAEDAQFYEHGGLSYWGMLRALVNDLKPGAHAQGASTLTQQLVRNLILRSNARSGIAGVKRKVQEMILAQRIETALSKDEILWLYLNQIDFGHQRFGVEEAARFYFGKAIAEVDAGEAALLASLPKGPFEMDPWKHPERAKDRQRYVLSQMVRYHHLDPKEATRIGNEPIKVVRTPAPFVGIAPEFVDEVKRILVDKFGAQKMPTLGLTVKTTCDARVQRLVREAVEKGLVDLDARQGYRKPLARLKGKSLAEHVKKLVRDFPTAHPMGRVIDGVVTEIVHAGKSGEGDGALVELGPKKGLLSLPPTINRYNPKAQPVDKRFAVGDVLPVRIIDQADSEQPILSLEFGPQAAAVVIDPKTREVKAIVGGYGYRPGGLDRARSDKPCTQDPNHAIAGCRQPGSAFKPFLYAVAFDSRKYTAASILNDSPQVYAQPGLAPWKPQNAEKHEYFGPVRLRVALARSLNTVASQLIDPQSGGISPDAVVKLAQDTGIESSLIANPSLALGTSTVSLFELTNAYATFAAAGKRMTPSLVKQIGDEVVPTLPATDALKPELAYLLTSMMTSVIEEGTGGSARGKLKRPAAGKTGTTDSQRDAWFVGYTPDLVAGVWVGFDDMRELGKGEQGARAALPIWVDIMNGALKGVPPSPFAQPPGVVVQRIDPASGLLAQPGAATALEEVFLEGTAPTQVAPTQGEYNPDTYIMDQAQ